MSYQPLPPVGQAKGSSSLPVVFPIVGITNNPTIANTSFGASISNFPTGFIINGSSNFTIPIQPFGASLHFNLDTGVSVTNFPTAFNISGTSNAVITMQPFGSSLHFNLDNGVSVTNFPGGFGASVTNFPGGFGSSVANFPTGFGASITNLVGITIAQGLGITGFPIVGVTNIVTTKHDMSGLRVNGVDQGVSHIAISLGSAGDNLIIAGSSGRNLYVLQYTFTEGVSNILKWKNGISSDLSGTMPFGAPGGIASPYVPIGIMRTGNSGALILNLQAGGSVGGHLIYSQI